MMDQHSSLKRPFHIESIADDEEAQNTSRTKHSKDATSSTNNIEISTLEDICAEIFLEIFQYLRPVDLLYSFTGLFPLLNTLIEPYTHTLDFRLMSKYHFDYIIQSLLPYLTNNLRALRLSNTNTFGQISEIVYKFDWSQINQLESLTFDSIKTDELSRYFLVIHPLLEHLWRLSITSDEDDKLFEKLLIDHILTNSDQSQSLTYCFITGITFDLSKLIGHNKNLRELTITLATINDLLILFQLVPKVEILTCTVIDSTVGEAIDKVQSLEVLTNLTLIIQKPISFKKLQAILIPHITLKRLSLIAILCDENSSSNSNRSTIGGLELEKVFRTFSQLNELHFYLRHLLREDTQSTYKPNHVYLFPFTSHFWLDRSIHVATHFIRESKQRYIYTLPFAFDTFHILDDIYHFFAENNSSYYSNVRHLELSSTSPMDEFIYSSMISKFFPNIQTITIAEKSSTSTTSKMLTNHRWILQKSVVNTSDVQKLSNVYIRNSPKASHLYFKTLDIPTADLQLFRNNSKRVRQLTVYEMTEQQWVNLYYYFPMIHALTLYVNTLSWSSWSNDLLSHLLNEMTRLFSLTVYYPKNTEDEKRRDLLANTLLAVKKHFYIKYNDGILNIWF